MLANATYKNAIMSQHAGAASLTSQQLKNLTQVSQVNANAHARTKSQSKSLWFVFLYDVVLNCVLHLFGRSWLSEHEAAIDAKLLAKDPRKQPVDPILVICSATQSVTANASEHSQFLVAT